ncbi:MAG: hypothetical protein AAGG50_12185 [Bacteroidota bacterium]
MSRLPTVFAVALVTTILFATAASGQDADWPEADPADVATTEAIVEAVYEAISGPSTEPRDWDRFRSLHHPAARLMPTTETPEGERVVLVFTPDEYADQAASIFRDAPMFQGKGFYEVEIARRVERYGSMAHVWSTYESRYAPDEVAYARGINSFQLLWDGDRWHILSIFWHQENDASPIPSPYLPEE